MTGSPIALVLGAERPFGAQIVERLRGAGFDLAADGHEGPIDVLIVNVPVRPRDIRFRDVTDDDFRAALDDQLYQVVAAGQAAVARMTAGGSIVHVASRAHLGAWGGVQDMAAGAALVAMGRSMALELDARGIRVNTLEADFAGDAWETPEAQAEIAAAVAWLAGPDSAGLSGETILVNRGRSLRMAQAAKR